jgi:hypothetical protein
MMAWIVVLSKTEFDAMQQSWERRLDAWGDKIVKGLDMLLQSDAALDKKIDFLDAHKSEQIEELTGLLVMHDKAQDVQHLDQHKRGLEFREKLDWIKSILFDFDLRISPVQNKKPVRRKRLTEKKKKRKR